jgi:hypothetical protein
MRTCPICGRTTGVMACSRIVHRRKLLRSEYPAPHRGDYPTETAAPWHHPQPEMLVRPVIVAAVLKR